MSDTQQGGQAPANQPPDAVPHGEEPSGQRQGELPDSWAGASVVLFREMRSILGVWAPWILVLGILGFGYFKFEELRSTYLDDVREAMVEIRESYNAMADINKKQIANFEDSLAVSEKLDAKLIELGELVAQRTQALQARQAELDRALADVAAAAQQQRDAEQAQEDAQDELEATQEKIEKSKQELQRRAATLGDLREGLSSLAEIARTAVEPGSDEEDKVAAIIARYVVDPVAIFTAYLSGGGDRTALDDLVGLEQAHLLRLIDSNQGFGAAFWLRDSGSAGEGLIIAAGAQDGTEYRDLLGIEIGEGRINESYPIKRIFATRLPDSGNWLQERGTYFMEIGDEEWETDWWEQEPGDSWKLSDILLEGGDFDSVLALHGSDEPKAFLGHDALRAALSQTADGRESLADPYYEPALNLGMVQRAADFDRVLNRANLQRLPASLRPTFEELLRAGVARDLARNLDPRLIGELAAAALQPGFAIAEVRRPLPDLYAAQREQQQQQTLQQAQQQSSPEQQSLPEQAPPHTRPLRLLVVARYEAGPNPQDLGHAAFNFEREEELAPWRLVEFAGGFGAEPRLQLSAERLAE